MRTRLVAGVLAACAAVAVGQENYPVKPVRVIAPSGPGGGFDLIGRVLAAKLSESLGQQFLVENRVGGGTLLGSQTVARAAPDGYTLLVGGLSNIALNMGLYKEPGYDSLADFAPIALVVSHAYILVGRNDLAPSNLKDLIAYARANPGKLSMATSGPGTGQHIGASVIAKQLGIDWLIVPHKAAQPAYQNLLAGRVDLFYDNITTAKAYLDTQRIKAYAMSGPARSSGLPAEPSFGETGVLQWEMETWFGLFAPARTPRPVIDRLRRELERATELPEVRRALEQGAGRMLKMSAAETDAFVRAEVKKWSELVKNANIKVD